MKRSEVAKTRNNLLKALLAIAVIGALIGAFITFRTSAEPIAFKVSHRGFGQLPLDCNLKEDCDILVYPTATVGDRTVWQMPAEALGQDTAVQTFCGIEEAHDMFQTVTWQTWNEDATRVLDNIEPASFTTPSHDPSFPTYPDPMNPDFVCANFGGPAFNAALGAANAEVGQILKYTFSWELENFADDAIQMWIQIVPDAELIPSRLTAPLLDVPTPESERSLSLFSIWSVYAGVIGIMAVVGFAVNRPMSRVASRLEHSLEAEEMATAQAEQRADTMNILAHGISHEIRSPIRAMAAAASRVKRSVDKPERLDVLIEQMESGATEANETLDGLLHMADSARIELNTVDLREVADEYASDDVGVTGRGKARADVAAVNTILRNLVENALAHGKTPVDITIDGSVVWVSDSGDGVPESMRGKLFELGFKGVGSAGSGVGLALSKTLATAMRGDLVHAPDSGGEEGGATFILTLKKDEQ